MGMINLIIMMIFMSKLYIFGFGLNEIRIQLQRGKGSGSSSKDYRGPDLAPKMIGVRI